MTPEMVQKAVASMQSLQKIERSASEYYRACSNRWTQETDFWFHLSQDETVHAANLQKMIKMVTTEPGLFWGGKLPEQAFIDRFEHEIIDGLSKIKDLTLYHRDSITTAIYIEDSFLEVGYPDIIGTGDDVFNAMLKFFVKETVIHRAELESLHIIDD